MTADDDRRALERFIAGLDVDDDALAAAISARAVDRTIVVESLLTALTSPHAAVRRRATERVARMEQAAPRILAELTVIAAADPDERTRAAAAEALAAHAPPVPGGVPAHGDAPARSRVEPASVAERLLTSLWLRPLTVRSTQSAVVMQPRKRADAPQMRATVTVDDDGRWTVALVGLPPTFAMTRPTIRVRRDATSDAYTAIGTAIEPVTADGVATIRIEPDVGPLDEVRRWFEREIQLVVVDG